MAPEQWLGSASVTDRADVYALGGILFELLAGHPPFPTQVIGDLIRSHLYVDAPNLSQEAADIPKEVSALIAPCCTSPQTDDQAWNKWQPV
jgi:serine/threonine protein kinase